MSKIERSWTKTLALLGAALGCLALSGLLFATIVEGPISTGIALIPGVLGTIFVVMAVAGAGRAPCPSCGHALDGLSTGRNEAVLCDRCQRYLEGANGTLGITPPDRVADRPVFSVDLPNQFEFPPQCCLCPRPATHREEASITVPASSDLLKNAATGALTGGVLGRTGGGTKYTVGIPHCDEHKGGAELGTGRPVALRFRSYAYWSAFRARNGIGAAAA